MATYYEKIIKQLSPLDLSDETIVKKLAIVMANAEMLRIDGANHVILQSQCATLLEFIKYGKKVFTFKEDLCYLLNFTDLKEVDASHIKLPFQCFYINGFHCLDFRTSNENSYVMDSVFVRGYPLNDATELMSIRGTVSLDKMAEEFNIKREDMLYALEFILTTESTEKLDDDYLVFPYILTKGDALKQITEKCRNRHAMFSTHSAELVEKLLKFILNCVLYINSDEAVIKNITPQAPKSSRKASRSRRTSPTRKTASATYYSVGSNITINRKEREAYAEACRDKYSRITASWIVRGHWHGYWKRLENIADSDRVSNIGETKALIKKWLQPYIKGNQEVAILHKNYTVNA